MGENELGSDKISLMLEVRSGEHSVANVCHTTWVGAQSLAHAMSVDPEEARGLLADGVSGALLLAMQEHVRPMVEEILKKLAESVVESS